MNGTVNMNKQNHVDRVIAVLLFALLIGGGSFSPAAAATRYVDRADPQCSDSGPGTAQTPFCTISKGASIAIAGDTVEVASGTYAEQVTVQNSGTSAAPITFAVADGASVTVTGQTYGFNILSRSWIKVQGFTISDTVAYGIRVQNSTDITLSDNHVTGAGSPISGSTRSGIYLNNTTDSLVLRNTANHNSDGGIYLVNGTTRVRVEGNITHHNARGYVRAAPGIDVRAPGNTIQGNISYDNEDTGIQFYSGASDNLAVNNVCYGGGDHGIDISSAPRHTVIGNTVYLTPTSAINLEGSAINSTLANNIIVDQNVIVRPNDTKAIIRVDSSSIPGTVINYDLVFKSQGNYPLIRWGATNYSSLSSFVTATGMETHGSQADPQWVAPASGDFHLTAFSPAIDSANSGITGATDSDIESQPRIDDSTPDTGAGPRTYDDRGAYEFQLGGGGDITPPSIPTDLTATAVSSSQINLSWSASDDNVGVTGYKVYRGGIEIATTASTSYSDAGRSPSTTYTYRVAAFDAAGNTSDQSLPASATTQAGGDITPPSIPTGLTATAVSSSQINLSWSASDDNVGVTGYKVYRGGIEIATTASTSYSDTGRSPSTTYTYRVAAFDAAGNTSDQSLPASATTQASSGATLTFNSTADATIKPGSPTTNFGSSKLEVDNTPVEHFLLKFTVSGIGAPIVSAKLRLYNINDSNKGGDFYRVANNAWSESSVTWNTAPAADATIIASLGAVAVNTWYEVDVTSLIPGNGTYSLRVTSTSADGADYRSKETAGFAPQLVVATGQ